MGPSPLFTCYHIVAHACGDGECNDLLYTTAFLRSVRMDEALKSIGLNSGTSSARRDRPARI